MALLLNPLLSGMQVHSVERTLAQVMAESPVTAKAGAVRRVTDYGGTLAFSDGSRWRLERLYLTWSGLPSASVVPVGTEASVTDCGGAIAVAGVSGWVFRPIRIRQVSTPVTVTGTTAQIVVDSFTVPAKLLGAKGQLKIRAKINTSSTNSNAKSTQFYFGGQAVSPVSSSAATYLSAGYDIELLNVNATNQVGGSGSNGAQNWSAVFNQLTVDTGVDQLFETKLQLAVGTDSITLKSLCIDIQPAM